MSAWRKAMLSVSPSRIENFSLQIKNNIKQKEDKKRSHRTKSKRSKHSSTSSRSKNKSHKVVKKSLKKTSTTKHSKNGSHKKKSQEKEVLTDSDIEENGLDLKVNFTSLVDQIKDREVLMQTVFKVLPEKKVLEIIPDVLKCKPIDDIKERCLKQLKIMSSERLIRVISGQELDFSSGTDSSEEKLETMNPKSRSIPSSSQETGKNVLQTNVVDSTTSDIASSNNSGLLFPAANPTFNTQISADRRSSQSSSISIQNSSLEHYNDKSVEKDVDEISIADSCNNDIAEEDIISEQEVEIFSDYEEMIDELLEDGLENAKIEESQKLRSVTEENGDVGTQKNQKSLDEENLSTETDNTESIENEGKKSPKSRLEILELEMRARAIRSLMKSMGKTKENNPK